MRIGRITAEKFLRGRLNEALTDQSFLEPMVFNAVWISRSGQNFRRFGIYRAGFANIVVSATNRQPATDLRDVINGYWFHGQRSPNRDNMHPTQLLIPLREYYDVFVDLKTFKKHFVKCPPEVKKVNNGHHRRCDR